MSRCRFCGSEMDKGQKYCTNCGQAASRVRLKQSIQRIPRPVLVINIVMVMICVVFCYLHTYHTVFGLNPGTGGSGLLLFLLLPVIPIFDCMIITVIVWVVNIVLYRTVAKESVAEDARRSAIAKMTGMSILVITSLVIFIPGILLFAYIQIVPFLSGWRNVLHQFVTNTVQ